MQLTSKKKAGSLPKMTGRIDPEKHMAYLTLRDGMAALLDDDEGSQIEPAVADEEDEGEGLGGGATVMPSTALDSLDAQLLDSLRMLGDGSTGLAMPPELLDLFKCKEDEEGKIIPKRVDLDFGSAGGAGSSHLPISDSDGDGSKITPDGASGEASAGDPDEEKETDRDDEAAPPVAPAMSQEAMRAIVAARANRPLSAVSTASHGRRSQSSLTEH